MLKFTETEGNYVKGGGLDILRDKLRETEAYLMSSLKHNKKLEDLRYFQGASAIVDELLKILK